MRIKKAAIALLRKVKRKILSKPKSFDMNFWASRDSRAECGTVGCIAGWVLMLSRPRFQESVRAGVYNALRLDWKMEAARELGIEDDQASPLFFEEFWPTRYINKFSKARSNKQRARVAANRIEHFIKTGGR